MADHEDQEMEESTPEQPPQPTTDTQNTSDVQPRLMIIKIVNENFKSYAGIQELGPFHKNFSSIVGPNGSGKSNVIDAMLFVFGYRSRKIRSKKVSNLIHNSGKHKNVESCTVTVHFQKIIDRPGDEYDVVPGSEFRVSRTARKDNSSDYYLNGRKAPFKEVAQVLRACGIDLDHNRFLILQGEVEQISLMKPKAMTEHDEGMLEYLEDIIGSNKYKEPIEELAKLVEQLNEQKGEKLNRVKAVEKEKDELEGAKNEAMEFIHLENEISRLKNSLYQQYIHECNLNEAKMKGKTDDVQKKYDELNEKLKEIAERKKAKGKEHKKIAKKFEELSKTSEETKKNFNTYEMTDLKLREDLKHRSQNAKKLKSNLEKEKAKVVELEAVPKSSEEKLEKLKKYQESLEKDKEKEDAKLQEIMEGLKTETQELQSQKEVKEKELMELSKGVNDAKSNMDVAKSELDIYRSQHQSAVNKFNEAKANLEKAEEKLQDRQSDIKNIQKELPNLKKKNEQSKADLEKAIKGEQEASSKLKSVRQKVEEARSSFQAAQGKGKVLDALMAQKKSGNIKGIYGRLGDLGAIDQKYDIAISTACGPLDNIVVDTMDTAQTCVKFLKENNLGIATFIGMDKMEKFRKLVSTKVKTPENVPRLIDLIKLKDEKFISVFYYALKNTLVANDLDQATRVAFQGGGWRVVSEQGDLIGQQGTMSGGGTKKSQGRMGSCIKVDVSPDELRKMEKNEEEISQQLQECREAKQRLEASVEEMSKEADTMEHNFEKFTMELQSLKEQIKELKVQVKDFEAEVKKTTPDQAKLQQLEKAVTDNEKVWKKATTAATKIEEQVQALHKKIMDIGGAKLNAQQRKVDNVAKQIDEAAGEITKLNVAMKTASRNKKKAEDKVVSLEKEIENNNTAMEQLEGEFSKLEEEAAKVLQEFKEAEDKKKEVEKQLEVIKEEYGEIDKEENELRTTEIDFKHEVEEITRLFKENQNKKEHWKSELSKIELQPEGPTGSPVETLPTLETAELEELDVKALKYKITVEEEKTKQMKPNLTAIAEYRKKEEIYLSRVGELDKITEERDQKRKDHEDMRKRRLDEFMSGFSVITTKLREMYQMITLGGDAELELVDSLDPFSEGIVFSVRPPKKSWKNISNLSGGEKTLSSLALVFALHHYKPTPLYVMDEIDAALDFRNVSIVANYIKERTKNAQFIIISLRNNMFELADRLVGIYKTHDCTKSVAINPQTIGKRG